MQIRRSDIVTVELAPTRGSEQKGTNRPCVVIQNDTGNRYSPTTIIAPFTKQYDPDEIYPFEVDVRSSNTVLDHDSVVDLSQIRVVDIDARIKARIGSVPSATMAKIDRAIETSLGL